MPNEVEKLKELANITTMFGVTLRVHGVLRDITAPRYVNYALYDKFERACDEALAVFASEFSTAFPMNPEDPHKIRRVQ